MSDLESALVYGLGCMAGGMTSATGIWVLGGLFQPLMLDVRLVALGLGFLWALVPGGSLCGLTLPQNQRQIRQEVLLGRGLDGSFQFGFEIGTGVRTYLPTTSGHVLAMWLLLTLPSLSEAMIVGAAFGCGRMIQSSATAFVRERTAFLDGWVVPVAAAARVAPSVNIAIIVLVAMSGR